MKKMILASIMALSVASASASASAMEVGVSTTRAFAGPDSRNSVGLNLTQKFGSFGVTAGFERFTKGPNDQDRFSLVLGYDVAKINAFTLTPKVGVAYLDNQRGNDGYAMTLGAGVSTPLTNNMSLVLDVSRQIGQSRISRVSDGNRVTLGVNYKF